MKRTIADDGTRTHELSVTEKRVLNKALAVVDELAYFHKDDDEGTVLKTLGEWLENVHDGESLVAEAPPEE